jgi:anti-anti-sigma regulatory factor
MTPRPEIPLSRAPTEPTAEPPGLAVHVDLLTGRLTATGRLGARTVHLLHGAVSALLRSDQRNWTVDVTDCDVADHAGLRALAGAYRRAVRHERRIALDGASPALRHALGRLRLDRHLLTDERIPTGSPPH